jgi:hypothetical protein
MGLSLKETVFVQAMLQFEDIGFMEWHCRVLKTLTSTPQSVREVAFQTGLFQYHVRGVVQDLLGLGLIEYTRYGLQLKDEHEMLLQLVECCEEGPKKKSSDYEAAFEVVVPKVVALKKRHGMESA